MSEFDQMSDDELILLLRRGNRPVSDYLMEKYKFLVRQKARAKFLQGGETDDLIQEGMIGLFKAIRDYDPGKNASFQSFAALCIDRQLYTAMERAGRKKHQPLNLSVSLDDESEEREFPAGSGYGTEDPETIFISQEERIAFDNSIRDSLSPLENKVLTLFLEGNSYAEIGEILGRSGKSVDNALRRIRTKIREKIRE